MAPQTGVLAEIVQAFYRRLVKGCGIIRLMKIVRGRNLLRLMEYLKTADADSDGWILAGGRKAEEAINMAGSYLSRVRFQAERLGFIELRHNPKRLNEPKHVRITPQGWEYLAEVSPPVDADSDL